MNEKLYEHFKGLTREEIDRLLPEGLILLGYRGSLAHGTFIPSKDPNSIDDKDVMGVFINPLDHYFGNKTKDTQDTMVKEWDAVSYELRHFVSLLEKANPNVLSLLWLKPNLYVHIDPLGQMLIYNRELFVSRKVFHSFVGYAKGQLKRMTHFKFEGYLGEKRKRLVEKYGYDTKNASHLIRILRQGIEFLREGQLQVLREDAPELIDIKTGGWKLEKVQEEADKLFARAERAYDECRLPVEPDRDRVNDLLIGILKKKFLAQ